MDDLILFKRRAPLAALRAYPKISSLSPRRVCYLPESQRIFFGSVSLELPTWTMEEVCCSEQSPGTSHWLLSRPLLPLRLYLCLNLLVKGYATSLTEV